ncbi:MAG: spermidine/putrescine ABC transporter substrate-binding protein [Cyanobium sp.]
MTRPIPPSQLRSCRPGSRRAFLTRATLAAGAAIATPALLAACGSGKRGEEAAAANRLVISNYPLYIDPDADGVPGSLSRFQRETGIAVSYVEDINDSQAFFARIRPDLAAGRPIAPDLFVTPYWLAGRLIELGWLEPLPLERIPNAANLVPALRRPSWDPSQRYSLPWQSGIAGIAYNIKATGRELTSARDLFDPALRGKVGILTEMRDAMGLLMLDDGQDISRPSFAAARRAFERLETARREGQIRAFTGNNYQADLLAGNFAACMAWSGDIAQLVSEQPDLRFLVPERGGVLWADVMVMPKGARHPAAAARWLNWVYDPVHAARIAASVQYITPVAGVQKILAAQAATAALARNPQMFPDAALEARLRTFGPLSAAEEARFDARFAAITQG